MKKNNYLPSCLYCQHFKINDKIISPIDNAHPCLDGTCLDCPFEDAYGYKYHDRKDKSLPIWIDLVTNEAWVDGSCTIKNCKLFLKSDLIF
jgi:hypothetical protein